MTGQRRKIDRPLKNTARGELEAPVAIDPRQRLALVDLNLPSAGVELNHHISECFAIPGVR
jgi:hypothetical protein